VLSGSDPVEAADFVSRTFPLLFASAEERLPQAVTDAGTGSITVVDADTIVVTLPGNVAKTYARISATQFSDASGEVLTFQDFGAAQYLFKTAGDWRTEVLGVYGFETPVALRPVTATYGARDDARSASVILYVPAGSASWTGFGSPGTVDLVATFTGSGGTIRGTLFEGSTAADFMGDGTFDDTLSVRTTLEGVIDDKGFTGTVGGTASYIVSGMTGDLNLNLTNTSVDGKFFGNAADVVSGAYSADTVITPPIGAPESGTLSGFFVAER
jgi:hypothetical protein